jgi:PAS domain S-box-containing protein
MLKFVVSLCVLGLLATGGALAGQRVRVAVFNNPPLVTYDAREHRAGGIFMDVLRYTAAREHWELEEVPGEPAQAQGRLDAGEVDLLPGVPHSKPRESRLAFTRETLANSWGRIYVRPRSSIEGIRDLAGKKVAVLRGSLLQQQLVERAASAAAGVPPTLLEYASFEEAFRAVADGTAEAVLTNRFTGALYARETGLRGTSVVLAPYGFRYAAKPGALTEQIFEALDRNLLLLKADPDSFYYRGLQELENGAREFFVPMWVYWLGAAALLLLALATGWAVTARRAAARLACSEAQLRKSNAELLRAHAELDRIGANSPDLIAVFDENFVVRRVNQATERLLGTPPEAHIGKSALDWVPHQRRHTSRVVLENVRAGARLEGHASEVLRADGKVVPFLWSLVWSEESQELYAIGHDDTERHQLIANLRRRTQQLQVVNRDLRTFAQSVSHDLRSPVAAVIGFIGKVLRDEGHVLQERSHALLVRAHAASQRMDGIISNLLRLARVTEGGIQRRDCDVTAMCQDVATALRCQEPGREVVFDIESGMHAHADRELLRHVFDNLLSNAWKFSAGKPRAHIKVSATPERDGPVFVVQDNGAGFDMAYAQNLFVPFGRLHSETEFDGVGIGLCVAHRVIAAHGGHIWAEGSPGAGATFRFTLAETGLPADLADEDSAAAVLAA